MTRILFLGDLAATGFGTVTMDLGKAMLDNGDDLRFLSLNEQPGPLPEPFASRTYLLGEAGGWITTPKTEDDARLMQARIIGLFTGKTWPDGWSPEAAIVVGDFEAVRQGVMPEALDAATIPVLHYCPVEGIDLPPRWGEFWSRVTPVAMSEFGATQIERVTGTRPTVVYHGVDTEVFFPISEKRPIVLRGDMGMEILRTKHDCKRFLGGDPKRTWLFRADRHMPRKRYPSLFRALAPVIARNPGTDLVYHCRTSDQGGNLEDAKSKYPPQLAARMTSTGLHDLYGGVDRKLLNVLYNAADIYVSVSAEGFGLTIAEAMAAGVPAIGIGYSSVPEVIGAEVPERFAEPYVEGIGGLIVRPIGLIDNPYDHFWASVDEPAFGQAVEHLIQHKKRRQELGWLASQHVQRTFSWAIAARQFHDLATERVAVAA